MFPVLRTIAAISTAAGLAVANSGLASPKPALAQPAKAGASRFALALVNDPRGKAIVDLGLDDFVVQEGATNREVLDVRVADYPVAIVIDNGAAARADFAPLRTAVTRVVERLGPRPIAIVTTAGTPQLIASFEDERETVLDRLKRLEEPESADGQPLRAAATAANAIRATGTLFSSLLIATSSPVEVSGTAADEYIAPIVDSRTVLHVVANNAGNGSPTATAFRFLAQQSRGEFTGIYTAPSFVPAFERLAARLSSELLIEYLVPVGSKAIDPKIGVRMPGARVIGLGVAPR